MKKLLESIRTTDWKLLSEQKLALAELSASPLIEKDVAENIDGIISFLDCIQDFTVADGIAMEVDVFPPRDTNGIILEVGDSVEVDENANDLINFEFLGTITDIKSIDNIIVEDMEGNSYTVDCPNDYLTKED